MCIFITEALQGRVSRTLGHSRAQSGRSHLDLTSYVIGLRTLILLQPSCHRRGLFVYYLWNIYVTLLLYCLVLYRSDLWGHYVTRLYVCVKRVYLQNFHLGIFVLIKWWLKYFDGSFIYTVLYFIRILDITRRFSIWSPLLVLLLKPRNSLRIMELAKSQRA